jgi:hypothetical protein
LTPLAVALSWQTVYPLLTCGFTQQDENSQAPPMATAAAQAKTGLRLFYAPQSEKASIFMATPHGATSRNALPGRAAFFVDTQAPTPYPPT